MKTLDFLAEAAQRILKGDKNGAAWVFHQVMTADDRLKFDGFLVQQNDPLAYEAGTPEWRFNQKVNRMVELEQQRRQS